MSKSVDCYALGCIDRMSPEVVLAVLLRSFRFSPSEKDIVWNLAGVNYPTVGKYATKPSLPMKMEVIKH